MQNLLKKRFPTIYSTCLRFNFDITKHWIPVSPAAHFIMGGVETDTLGRTNIEGLFAAGEVACTGVHGANRLASNSLLEGLVYGYRAACGAIQYVEGSQDKFSSSIFEIHIDKQGINRAEINKMREELRQTMWEKVGVIRCGESLGVAKAKIIPFYEKLAGRFFY